MLNGNIFAPKGGYMPKKPPVTPETYRGWLGRVERGESARAIAEAEHYDLRTVRKNIERTRQEQEMKEARSAVLRQALERHYEDLIAFAGKLQQALGGQTVPLPARSDRMWAALQKHLP